MSEPKKGGSILEGLVVLGVLIVILAAGPKEDRGLIIPSTNSEYFSGSPSNYSSGSSISGRTSGERTGKEAGSISIGSGNASYAYQPYEEYVTIENRGEQPIDITNWQFKNGRDKRPYYVGGSLQRFSADIAIIPQGVKLIPISGSGFMQNIILARGERAIVTTGLPGTQSPYRITSFKENMCTGYLESMPEYNFFPPLSQSCPRPYLEPGIESLDNQCRDFIRTLSACQIPKFEGKDIYGDRCDDCVNGQKVSPPCKQFIKERFSYQGCLAVHASDANFEGKTWRVFLGRGWEMWDKEYESIELFNSAGQLVDYQNY